MLITGARAAAATPVPDPGPGWLRVEGARIAGLARGAPPSPLPGEQIVDLPGGWLLPGFVDLHCHGGGGGSFSGEDTAGMLAAASFHRRHGTTTLWASLVSAPPAMMERSARVLAELVEQGELAGIHLEGPFLASSRRGAQNPRALLAPDRGVMARLLDAGRGHVRMVTLAPELPGALELVRQLSDAGALAAIGHTDASYEQVMAAIDAGARVATHLFNGMRPVHHREPGPVIAALQRPEVSCEVIGDPRHLHPAAIRLALNAAGTSRVALVTDAIAAAGMADGRYELGGLRVEVRAGAARLAGAGTPSLAGSTITMDAAVRWVVNELHLELADAVRVTSGTAAELAGVPSRCGRLAAGRDADLVLCDASFNVVAVMARGQWVGEPPVFRRHAGLAEPATNIHNGPPATSA
ncbi:MAG TPA: N-acetylglucosamine-6-phosphate deacetylase [Acidimicrobiales bacterium]|nr:N-acetylglucosamine-6-phosphate deacetylase [Acidimicrobiales bacterium]